MVESYDALVVGAGPAGLSAANILGRCLRRVLVCGSADTRNRASAHIHGLLGHDGRPPSELRALALQELRAYSTVNYLDVDVLEIGKHSGRFEFRCSDGSNGVARKVLLATGLVDELPKIRDIARFYGRSVHHCLYCDGYEHRGKALVAYGEGNKGTGLALMMRQWSPNVVLCTDRLGDPDQANLEILAQHGIRHCSEQITELCGTADALERIAFADGSSMACAAMFFTTGCSQKSALWQTLGCTRDAKGSMTTDPDTEETSVPGVYAAGDVSRDVLLVAVAVGEGAKAAVAINRALLREDGLLR